MLKSTTKTLLIAALISACAIPTATAFASADDAMAICNVRGIMGTVRVFTTRERRATRSDVSTWPEARLNMPLRAGDRIVTAAESEVRLELADGSTVRLRERSELEISELRGGASAINTKLNLRDGSLVASVVRAAGGRTEFTLETPTSLAAIRGTTVELVSRPEAGTTVKTFDGTVDVASRRNPRQISQVGNFQIAEIDHSATRANVWGIPRFYRPKTTRLLSEEDMEALTGFRRVILTIAELEEVQRMLDADGIASAVGIGEADNEQIARTVAADNARAMLATSMGTQVQRLSESYSQNINNQARTIWEEGVRQMTDVSVRGSHVHRSITQHNPSNGRWKVYSLMIIDPNRMRNVMTGLADRTEAETGLRVNRDDMMSRMDASIRAFNTRYHDR